MTALALAVAAVLIIGVTAAFFYILGRRNRSYANGHTDGYARGYEQGKFDEYMDRITGYDAHAARLEAYGEGEVTR
jgi:hypothetical protein